jgi:single-stranded DNA-binding protein
MPASTLNQPSTTMLDVIVSGHLIHDPVVRTGQNGKPFTTALLKVPLDQSGESAMVSCIAFGEEGERLAESEAGGAVALTGHGKVASWESGGETRHGLNVRVASVLTLGGTARPVEGFAALPPAEPVKATPPGQSASARTGRKRHPRRGGDSQPTRTNSTAPTVADVDFDDPLGF